MTGSLSLIFAGAVLAVLLPASTIRASCPPPTGTTTRIMPVGDSNTMGALAHDPRPWSGYRKPLKDRLTAERYAVDLVGNQSEGAFSDPEFVGWGGWSIEMHRPGLAAIIEAYRPQAMLVLLGTNDMFEGKNPPPAYPWNAAERLETLLELIYQTDPCVAVIVSEIPPISTDQGAEGAAASVWVAPFNDALPGIISRRQAAGQHIKLQSVSGLETDGLHFTAQGYAGLADRWYDSLRSFPDLLARRPGPPQPINPNGIGGRRPTFRWAAPSEPVTGYALYDAGPSDQYDLVQTYNPDLTCTANVCAAEAPYNLQDGPHTYWLIAWNAAGWGQWSDPHSYCVNACEVTRPPAPTVSAGFPEFHWTDIGGAVDGYAIYDLSDGATEYGLVRTVDGHDPCADGVCAVWWPIAPTPGGHTAWVIAWNAAGWGQWSEGYAYCVGCAGHAAAAPSPSPGAR